MRRLAQGHLAARLGGAGDRTSDLPVTSRPALPPEPHAARFAGQEYDVSKREHVDETI